MAFENMISTPGEIKNMGGEVLTQMPKGAIIGAIVGFCVAVAITLLHSSGIELLPALNNVSAMMVLLFSVIFFGVVFGFAGLLVGIGIPKFNPKPEQGMIKRWRKTVLMRGGRSERVIYVPEEKRQDKDREYHLT